MENREIGNQESGIGNRESVSRPLDSFLVSHFLFLLCTFAFFGNVLFGTAQFAFRDGAHFYYPLYQYIQAELSAGRLPLWMPYENLGQPLAGNPAAGLFYPGKLLFFLPLDFTTLYHWFIVLHVFCAATTMYRLVRHYGKSEAASTFAAITYAFGGSVLYQHLNVIFLIGAAWFPELIRQTLRQKQVRSLSCGPSILIALMVLGGDVQAAYHAGLVVLFILGPKKSVKPLLLAFLLAAIQILPAWELSRESNRTQTGVPRSVWEVPFAKSTDTVFDGLLCRNFEQRGHARTAYNYSVPPWRLAEMVWPNVGGKPFPENTRWFSTSPVDQYVWVPSLYCGVLALVLAIVGSFQRRFLALIFFVLVAGSFGSFGIGWLLNTGDIGDPVGGIYWLMNVFLPGYAQFRYPAKLLTLAAVPFAVLAAYGLDRVTSREIPLSYVRSELVITFISVVLFNALLTTRFWDRIVQNVPACVMFGPFQTEIAKSVVACSLLQTIVVLSIFTLFSRKRYAPILFVLLCCLDLYLANHWMIPTVDRRNFARQSVLLEKIAQTHQGLQPPRIYRYSIWYPPQFKCYANANRFEESVAFDRATLWPKYTLENRVSIVNVRGTMVIQSYGKKLEELHAVKEEFETRAAKLGIEYVILPGNRRLNREEAVRLYSDPANDVSLWKLKQPGPIAWTIDGKAAKNVSYEPNRVVLETETAQSQTLVLAEQYWPGWKAKIANENGEHFARIFPVNAIFRGIEIPPGKCRVEFYYDPFLLKLGATGTLLGCIFVLYHTQTVNKWVLKTIKGHRA